MKTQTHKSKNINYSKINYIKSILTDEELHTLLQDVYTSTKNVRKMGSREYRDSRYSTTEERINEVIDSICIGIYRLYYFFMLFSRYFKKEMTWSEVSEKLPVLINDTTRELMEVEISLVRLNEIKMKKSDNNDLDVYLNKICEYLKGIEKCNNEIKKTNNKLDPKSEGYSVLNQELRAFDIYEFISIYKTLFKGYLLTLKKLENEGRG